MDDPFQMQRELRYGAPVCDQLLVGRYFTIGYSWYFRQAKWTLEIVSQGGKEFAPAAFTKAERLDNFRADLRVPHRFRASLRAYSKSGYDRGHLVASANANLSDVRNSETFLLSNMSPQTADFNRQGWRKLEDAVRQLNAQDDVIEVYVLNCPYFDFMQPMKLIGDKDDAYGIKIPVPHGFIKSVLAEYRTGDLKLWTFKMPNAKIDKPLSDYLIKTYDAEQLIGGRFWDRVAGGDMHQAKGGDPKRPIEKMWKFT
ncbi:MAG: DNA/RNA non-specific endonuclease [Sphingomonadaceae bacterium]|nr:DNA/RNA non-specific endonuclease [Sphingomonadaceae bacterium]